jgi:hypothetical protein
MRGQSTCQSFSCLSPVFVGKLQHHAITCIEKYPCVILHDSKKLLTNSQLDLCLKILQFWKKINEKTFLAVLAKEKLSSDYLGRKYLSGSSFMEDKLKPQFRPNG